MSTYIRWEFWGHTCKDGDTENLTSKHIEELVELDVHDLDALNWECGETLFGWGETSSSFAYDRIEEALHKFAETNPEVTAKVLAFYETEPNIYGFLLENGKCIPITGEVRFYRDDNHEEVVI